MGWIMDGLDKEEYDRTYSDGALFRRILGYFSNYKIPILLVSLAITFDAFAQAFIPVLLADLIDALDQNPSIAGIADFLVYVGAFFVLSFIMIAMREIFTARAVHASIRDLRRDAFTSLIKRDLSFFDSQPSGKIASRVTNDTTEFGTTVTLTANLLSQVFGVVFILYFLSLRSVRLTIITALFIPIVTITALSYRRIARWVSLRSQRVIAKVNSLIQETTTGIYVAKSFRAEESVYNEFEDLNVQNFKTSLFRSIIFISIFPVLQLLTAVGTATVVYLGALDVAQLETQLSTVFAFIPGEELSIADWFLFYQSLQFFYFPIIQIASYWSQFQQGLAASERVFSLIDGESKVVQYDDIILDKMVGKIEFRDMTFGYDDELMVLEKFNLIIQPGEKVAIVGHTGAGKSTIGKLISRYYEYQDGHLLIDDTNIRGLDMQHYRSRLSIISQEVFLWNASLKENLLYGIERVEGIEDRLVQVLQRIDLMDWVNGLEEGLDTQIGERGDRLSMGERQLVAFARILLRDPAILIMDEATASVDPLTEVKIQRATNELLQDRTSIVIAHRLSTIRNADRIIVMEQGKIIEEGSHKQLLKQGGHYAELYDTYYRHQTLEYIESFVNKDNE